MSSVERDEVERPFIEQLKAMGWIHVHGPDLGRTGQELERAVLPDRIGAALKRINRRSDGSEWVDDATVQTVIDRMESVPLGERLLESNRLATDMLLHGIQVPGDAQEHRGRLTNVHAIDWDPEHLDRNEFLVVDQFRVSRPDGGFSVLDLVLFVNGAPVAVVECKSPDVHDAIGWAIRDLQSYRGDDVEIEDDGDRLVGIPHLFRTVQLLVAASGEQAVLGTISAGREHFAAWRSVEPVSEDLVRSELLASDLLPQPPEGQPPAPLTDQQKLVAAVLRRSDLLNILRHYVVIQQVETGSGVQDVKIVCRYPQYRAVEKTVRKLLTGRTTLETGGRDERSGVIWHTQGSGKSLTMAFLVRRIRTHPELSQFLVVVATDRTQLQQQLDRSLRLSEEKPVTARSQTEVERLLTEGGRRVVMAMIQKYRGGNGKRFGFAEGDASSEADDRDLRGEYKEAERSSEAGDQASESDRNRAKDPYFPLCNDSPNVLVLIDEAHRSHTSVLHACLRQAIPNAAFLGFTGTPIMRGRSTDTSRIFGAEGDGRFLDEYRMEDAERDGAVVRIRYEGRTGPGQVSDRDKLDQRFDDLLADRTPAEKAALAKRWPTSHDVAESPPMIRAKAADMLRHWVVTSLPGGFKAQVAAASRQATVIYREALMRARGDLLAEVDAFDPMSLQGRLPEELTEKERLLLTAWRFRAVLRSLVFVPVISAGNEKKAGRWTEWTDEEQQKRHIVEFHKPLPMPDPDLPWSGADQGSGTSSASSDGVAPQPSKPTNQPWAASDDTSSSQGMGDADVPDGAVAFLIVKSMLLTGFDAPREQVLYLDRPIRDAELLQAVARVNRPAPGKDIGYVVDYYGVFEHLGSALAGYAQRDVDSTMRPMADEVPVLRRAAYDLEAFLQERGIGDISDPVQLSEALHTLEDEEDRVRFDALLLRFSKTMERILPDPAGLDFVPRLRDWTLLQKRVRRRYRDDEGGQFTMRRYGRKVRAMIAEHLDLSEIEQAIPPVSITSVGFDEAVADLSDPREAAAEMEHALRFHLEERVKRTDPVRYQRLSERLENILQEFQNRWEEQKERMGSIVDEARDAADDPETVGLSPLDRALYGLVRNQIRATCLSEAAVGQLHELTVQVRITISQTVGQAAYRGEDQDLRLLAGKLFEVLRRHWRRLDLSGDKLTPGELDELSHRISAYANQNRVEFRHRGSS
ncbi:hypothetical protein GCM10009799_22010 [Nocardiopsis rhodophaea]|uniref:type I site-specific deoxyribonuclease n=1 Tax=Nocardiopsis rhodophaea TaxID=280238 RepID=A0ABN2SZD5_9ACTN